MPPRLKARGETLNILPATSEGEVHNWCKRLMNPNHTGTFSLELSLHSSQTVLNLDVNHNGTTYVLTKQHLENKVYITLVKQLGGKK